jgi:hypothetical protein
MSKKLVFIFLLAFQIEVRVRANDIHVEALPEGCLKSEEVCAIQASEQGLLVNKEGFKLHTAPDTGIVKLSQDEWRLLKGVVWVEESEGIKIETVYGTVSSRKGEFWLLTQGQQKVLVRNVNANLIVTLRDGKRLDVPEGFEFWISGVNSKGQSEFGMIQPLDIKNHLKVWNSLYEGSPADFKNEVGELKVKWKNVPEVSSAIYKSLAQREIESVEKKRKTEAENQAHSRKAAMESKSYFYKRTFER